MEEGPIKISLHYVRIHVLNQFEWKYNCQTLCPGESRVQRKPSDSQIPLLISNSKHRGNFRKQLDPFYPEDTFDQTGHLT